MNLVNWRGSLKSKFAFSDHSFKCLLAVRWQDSISVPWTENLKSFSLPTLIFCSFLDNVEIIVNKIFFFLERNVGVTERVKIVKSIQSYGNGRLSYHCSFYY